MSKSPKDSTLGHFLNLLQSLIQLYLECRFAKYHQTNGYDSRDFIKAYGILFKVEVTGTVLLNLFTKGTVSCRSMFSLYREEHLISPPLCSSWDP